MIKRLLFNVKLLTSIFIGLAAETVSADVLPNTTAGGVAYLTYNRSAWATVAPTADFYDIHGNDLGISALASDVLGKRWLFPDRFEGTNWVAASYPASYLTPLPDYPLLQPMGGFLLPVNTYRTNSFATNHAITSYNSTENPHGYIGLGGSLRTTSDFNEPGASVWWEHLALGQDPADGIWKLYATSGPGKGSIFQLTNVTTETINGNLHLSADYVFGDTDWLQFLQDYNGHVDINQVLGHIELIPDGITKLFAGNAIIHYSQAGWESLASGIGPTPVLTLSGFFDQAQANALTQSNLLHDLQTGYSYTNQLYALNGPSVTNLPSRYTQPTTFIYQRGNPTNQSGSIGLGGVARFAVFGGAAGSLLYGDFTLQYDPKRLAVGGSGWYLQGNIPPASAVFDLTKVNIVETGTTFTLTGDLGVSFEVANFLYNSPGDTLADVGTISFTGYTVPFTTPIVDQVAVADGGLVLHATNGLPGSSYMLLSTTNLKGPASSWTPSGSGTFDGQGNVLLTWPIHPGESIRFFQIQQP